MKTELCKCGHARSDHGKHYCGDCLVIVDKKRGTYCRCTEYRPAAVKRKESQRVAAAVMGR